MQCIGEYDVIMTIIYQTYYLLIAKIIRIICICK